MTDRSAGAVTAVVTASRRHSGLAIAAWVLITVLALVYTGLNLRVDADTRELMSSELPWRQDALTLAQAFPERARQLIVVIDGSNTDIARARDALVQALSDVPDIDSVFAPAGDPWLQRHGLLFLSPEQLQQTVQQLEQAQPFLGRLAQQPTIAALAELLQRAQQHREQLSGLPLRKVNLQWAAAFSSAPGGALDWTALVTPSAQVPARELVLVVPQQGLSPANAVAAVNVGLDAARRAAPAARLRLTGPAAMQTEEMREITAGVIETAWCSLLGVTLLIAFALRSWQLTAACLLTMLVGLALTTGFATLVVGRLNLISASFAALYIGLAIAYALHFCMRAIEERAHGKSHEAAMRETAAATGTALLLSALTTAAAFYAFIPTQYAAVAELGLIAGSGLLIGFLLTVSLLPALIERYGIRALERAAQRMPKPRIVAPVRDALRPSRRALQVLALLLAVGSAWLLPQLRFDHNPLHLNPKNSESFQTLRELMNSRDTPLTASALADDRDSAERLSQQLQALPEVSHSVSAASLVPAEQPLKLELIADLQLALGGGFPVPTAHTMTPDPARDLVALQHLAAALTTAPDDDQGTHALAAALNQWLLQPSATTPEALQALSQRLLGGLPALLTQINTALEAGPVTLDDLPDSLKSQWISAEGRWRVEAIPAENLDDDAALQRYADAVRSVAPHASDAPIEFAAAARSVIEAFTIAFSLALAVILLCLRALLGNFGDSLRALAPVLLGSLLLCAICVLIDLPLNMANLIALPLLLGTNVDAAIHLVLRARSMSTQELSGSSTGRAVVYMVLAELAGFASLMLSPHQGIASLGLMFTLGLLLTLGCILWLLPALLVAREAESTAC